MSASTFCPTDVIVRAVLSGDALTPVIKLSFNPNTRIDASVLPAYPKPNPPAWYRGPKAKVPSRIVTLGDWVKFLPGRRWDKEHRQWIITAPGPEIERVLAVLGFDLQYPPGWVDGWSLDRFYCPVVLPDVDEWCSWVFPRFASPGQVERALPAFWLWDAERSAYLVRTPDLNQAPMLPVAEALRQKADFLRDYRPPGWDEVSARHAIRFALAKTVDQQPGPLPIPELGEIQLFGFQDSGVKALSAGRRLLADEPGLGKTPQAIAAHKTLGSRRLVVTVPPIVVSNWGTEIRRAWPEATVVTILPGRDEPELPETGIVVVSDALLAARPRLVSKIVAWGPDGMASDEAHRYKTFDSKRTRATTRVAHAVSGPSIPMTGTPIISNPLDLVPILDIAGLLEPVFGGASAFVSRFCRWDPYRGWVARKRALPELGSMLDSSVWVRRTKDQVLDLPELMSITRVVDVNLKEYESAHKKVNLKIDRWLESLPNSPNALEVEDWCKTQFGLISSLRMGAGLAKVDAATEIIATHLPSAQGSDGTWTRPLIVWCHHRRVTKALIDSAKKLKVPTAAIWGDTKPSEIPKIVDSFQAGEIAVLICSITAAGVGITLTRAADALFVETDWTPALVQQAIDRMRRIGQSRSMIATTLVAEDTLDQRIHGQLAEKTQILSAALGKQTEVAANENDLERATAAEILEGLVQERLRRLPHS